jgi:zinc transporter
VPEDFLSLGETVMRPGLIWGCAAGPDGTAIVEDCEERVDGAFRWLHLNLSDHRSLRWIAEKAKLPPLVRELMLSKDDTQRALVQKGVVGLVLHDFERDFDVGQTNRIGILHVAIGPTIVVTGRFHPLHSADIVRQRLLAGEPFGNAADALELLLGSLSDGLMRIVAGMTSELLEDEDEFLAHGALPDTRDLVAVRRRAAQIHRMLAGMRATLQRLSDDPALPPALAPVVRRFHQRLHALDGDVVAVQGQLRLLRDELDLQAAQRTNQNIYFLSIMTALMLPATLVTGFFGMNTGGLPMTGANGTLLAGMLAVASSIATYLLLRMLGFVRR